MKNIPRVLQPLMDKSQWVNWKNQDGKKLPYQAKHPNKLASTADPETWSSYEDAHKAAPNVGFVLKGSFGALDLDDCRDPDTGKLDPWAQELVHRANGSYVEVTPSKCGLRIIGTAEGASVHTSRQMPTGKVEIYRDTARYITVSGDQLGDCTQLCNIDDLIDEAAAPTALKDRSSSGLFHGEVCKLAKKGWSAERIEAHMREKPALYQHTKADQYQIEQRLRKEIERSLKNAGFGNDQANRDGSFERCLSEYEEEKIQWLWPYLIPLGMVTVFEGEGERGKSRVLRYIAAQITSGKPFYGQTTAPPPGNVLIASFTEDPVESVIRPQIRTMGGDLTKVFIIDQAFTLDEEGITKLSAALERTQAKVLMLDPLSDYVPSKANSYKDAEVRRYIMGPLTQLARQHHIAIIAIRHFKKSTDGDLKYRGEGSVGFTNIARATVGFISDDQDPSVTIMGMNKSNIVPRSKRRSLRFEIKETLDEVGCLKWSGYTDVSINEIDREQKEDGRPGIERQQAAEFLREELKNGPMEYDRLKIMAEKRSIAARTLRRASEEIGVLKSGAAGQEGKSLWSLPEAVVD